MTISTEMSQSRQQKARNYARIKRWIFLVQALLLVGALVALCLTGWSLELRKLVESWTDSPWLTVPLFALIFGGAFTLLTLPFDIYVYYYLPRKYGMLHANFGAWLTDAIKGGLIGGIVMLFLLEMLYFGFRLVGEWWWLTGGLFYLLFIVVVGTLAPVIVLPLFNRFTPLENDELQRRIQNLSVKTGAQVKGIYTTDFSRRTTAANAYVTGIGSTRRVVLGDTLTDNYSPDEIEVIMAHELGHHVSGDIWRGILLDSVLTLAGFFVANLILQATVPALGYRDLSDPATLPLFLLVMFLYGIITTPLGNAHSRSRERAADRYALKITNNATSFVSAMKKLANQNLADLYPPRWAVWYFYTHPPIAERISWGERNLQNQARAQV